MTVQVLFFDVFFSKKDLQLNAVEYLEPTISAISVICVLAIVPITLDKLNAVTKSKYFQHRIKEENRLDEVSRKTRKFMVHLKPNIINVSQYIIIILV